MNITELSPAELKAADLIQKLLNKAAMGSTPEEAALFTAKAQELMAKHNLDQATVEGAKPGDGKRETAMVDGGFYEWQRSLWRAVAELNFCLYWSQKFITPDVTRQNVYKHGEYVGKKYVKVRRRRHAMIGRTVNVRVTSTMAPYLEQAIKRICTEACHGNDENMRSNWAKSFQAGAADEIVNRLQERRRKQKDEEAAAQRRAAAAAKTAGHSTSTALSLATYAQTEQDANEDERFGLKAGTSAADRAECARVRQVMEAAHTAWAKEHPKEAYTEFSCEDPVTGETLSWARSAPTGRSYENKNLDYSAYSSGAKAAKKVGLDAQAGGRAAAPQLAGRKDIYA